MVTGWYVGETTAWRGEQARTEIRRLARRRPIVNRCRMRTAIPQRRARFSGILFNEMQKVALLGLGVMGSGMAGQLLQAGFPLTVYNRNAERAAEAVKIGARLAESPREAAQDADVIIAMLADDDASRDVWLGEAGALRGAKLGAVAVECSTLSPAWVAELATAAHAAGCEFLDAPVTGSRPQAAGGRVAVPGGRRGGCARARAAGAEGDEPRHCASRPSGSGARMKLINNFVCGVQAAALGRSGGGD